MIREIILKHTTLPYTKKRTCMILLTDQEAIGLGVTAILVYQI